MKLIELEIHDVRGIRHAILKPNGKNFVVWGPNGSGKSAVVDAVDFLLTGKITRLTGKGTGNITLNKHGPHIDSQPENAVVRALLEIKGANTQIEIQRCMAHPNVLEYDKAITSYLEPVLTLARRGQHVLTRREILKFITAEGGTRAEEIQEILNVTDIEEVRRNLVKVQGEFTKAFQSAKRNLELAEGAVNATTQSQSFQREKVLELVNQNRALLGALPVSVLRVMELKIGIKLPAVVSENKLVSITLLEKDIANLNNILSDSNVLNIAKVEAELKSHILTVNSDPKLLKAYSQQRIISLGLDLIDETGECPLCDKSWNQGELRNYLLHKLESAQVTSRHSKLISELSKNIQNLISPALAGLEKIIAVTRLLKMDNELPLLIEWQEKLQSLDKVLLDPISKYLESKFEPEDICCLMAPKGIDRVLATVLSSVKEKFPEAAPEQSAWDTLTRLEENLKSFERAEQEYHAVSLSYQRAVKLVENFEVARDKILGNLYNKIRERFVNLYKQIHGEDEDAFDALLEPDGAALNLSVSFYGRGVHPPHALHSEGHQDSMGLCLYLALAEYLTGDFIDLTILDDVVMSVDADHRRELCRLLGKEFPNRQFLITTHDKTWATQLRAEGVVNSKGLIEFYNWNVNTGPQLNNEVDTWEKIEVDIAKNDVSSAAARLRRNLEQFFSIACDSLQASVRYRSNLRWELSDFMPAAFSQYKNLIKHAKNSAKIWGSDEVITVLDEIESTASQIYVRTNAEQWAINASVHYNNWANLSSKDFRPVVDAFQDLCALFICSSCKTMLHVTTVGLNWETLKCNCGKVNWNLRDKK